jgi:hypothetical protein
MPTPLASLSAMIVIAPVVLAPTVPPIFNVMWLSASRVMKPEPESIAALVMMSLLPPLAVSVTAPPPLAEIAWLTVRDAAPLALILPLEVVVRGPLTSLLHPPYNFVRRSL